MRGSPVRVADAQREDRIDEHTPGAPPAEAPRAPGAVPTGRGRGRLVGMEDAQRDDHTDDHTPGAPPAEDPGSPQAVAERVVRLLANPRRIRRP